MILPMNVIHAGADTATVEELQHQITLRRKFAQECVGSLYPSIMHSQIEQIQEILRSRSK